MPLCQICSSCGARKMSIFYKLKNVPVHSVLLLPTQDEAKNYPKGNIVLAFCQKCGHISNVAFDPKLQEYSTRYEGTQAYSPMFNSFQQKLAEDLIQRYDLWGKDIIEIGCGQGEFLTLLCNLGENRGIGFDPSFTGRGNKSGKNNRVIFIKDFYSEKYARYRADLICCKMTLEHIHKTADFIKTIRRSIGNKLKTSVFFQVPNMRRILQNLAFWDIYYEHCSYFSFGSLAHLFRRCGFDVTDLWKGYDDQYLMIEAKPRTGKERPILNQEENLEDLTKDVAFFAGNYSSKLEEWQRYINEIKQKEKRTVIWGSGSKGVAFLTTLKIQDQISFAVDINPNKHGTYMAGTGHRIVGPDFFKEYKPDTVIVMNPIYSNEIRKDLERMKIPAKLVSVR